MEIWSWTQTWAQIQDHSCMVFVLSQTREHVDSVLTQTWHSSGLGLYSDLNELVSVTLLASGTGLRTARWVFLTNCVVSQMKQGAGNMSAWHLSFLHASALVPSGVFFFFCHFWSLTATISTHLMAEFSSLSKLLWFWLPFMPQR